MRRLALLTVVLSLAAMPATHLAAQESGSGNAADAERSVNPLRPVLRGGSALRMAADLDGINAAYVALTGRNNVAPPSAANDLRSYEAAKVSALDMPGTSEVERAARQEAIASANALLERLANLPVTESVVAEVDALLGIGGGR
jgi:hypothetical protein